MIRSTLRPKRLLQRRLPVGSFNDAETAGIQGVGGHLEGFGVVIGEHYSRSEVHNLRIVHPYMILASRGP